MSILSEQRWKHDVPVWRERNAIMADFYTPPPAGPWDDEPDKVQWIDGDTDLDCLAVRNPMGAWCGYVGVPPDHPLYQQDLIDTPDLDVHGGISFASMCDEDAPEGHGICHIPLPGRPDDVWWLGFDCGHAWDLQPGVMWQGGLGMRVTYRDLAYVQHQCAELAGQIRALG